MRNLILVPVDLSIDPSMFTIVAPHVVRGRVDDLLDLPLDLLQPRLKVFSCLLKLALLLLNIRLLPMHGLLQALHRLKESLRELHKVSSLPEGIIILFLVELDLIQRDSLPRPLPRL